MLNSEEILALATDLVSAWTWQTETDRPETDRLDVRLASADDLVPIVALLRVKRLGHLAAITGLDPGGESGELEVLYHFCTGPATITLRVRLPRENPSVQSLSALIPMSEAFERELSEMYGINVLGLRNQERLYLPDDWPAGLYPLRKDADLASFAGAE
jgi:Ni,Fe-hydrogenase III component G